MMNQQEEKFARLVRENKSTIYTVCYMFSKDEDEVNDLFQETLINIWKGIGGFRAESKETTWIYRVAMNTCLNQQRKKKREGDTEYYPGGVTDPNYCVLKFTATDGRFYSDYYPRSFVIE